VGASNEPDKGGTAIDELAELASMIAHELRNAVMSIKGLATTGERLYDSLTDDERREFFRLIDQEATRLSYTAEEISTALRIDSGRLEYHVRRSSLSDLIAEATKEPRGAHPTIVEVEEGLEFPFDRKWVRQAIENLLDNADKYSPPGAPIDVRARRQADVVAIEVEDRGPGIPVDKRELVFERFTTVRPAGYEETPGAGLGLYIARAHVLAHGGAISIGDGPISGTILRFTLPARSTEHALGD